MLNVSEFLNSRPANYARQNYDLFLREVAPITFKRSIHIAGTNGKGSTAMFLFEICRAAGYKTALYISPHFKDYKELARVNDQNISDEFIAKVIMEYFELIEKYQLSFFEIITFVSFKYFESENVDVAIIETGLGGLIDATNIFIPTVSVITNVHTDHIVEIGPEITDIARHKAGIIKRGVPVISGVQEEVSRKIIEYFAHERNSPLIQKTVASSYTFKNVNAMSFVWKNEMYEINSGAVYEVDNAAMVLEVIDYFVTHKLLNVTREHIDTGLRKAKMPARFTIVKTKPLVIVDGAHNMHGIKAFISSVKALGTKKIKVIYAAFHDKEILRILDYFKIEKLDVLLTTFEHERAAQRFPIVKLPFEQDYKKAIAQTINENTDAVILICGSLFFANLVLEEF